MGNIRHIPVPNTMHRASSELLIINPHKKHQSPVLLPALNK